MQPNIFFKDISCLCFPSHNMGVKFILAIFVGHLMTYQFRPMVSEEKMFKVSYKVHKLAAPTSGHVFQQIKFVLALQFL